MFDKYLLNELINPYFKNYTSRLESEGQHIFVTCPSGKLLFSLLHKEKRKEEGEKEGPVDLFIISVNAYDSPAGKVHPMFIEQVRQFQKKGY